MDCQDDDKEKSDNNEKTVQMLNQMEIKFKERFTEATEQDKHEINVCLDTLACMSQQSSDQKSCSQLEIQCVIQIPPKFVDTEAYFHSNSIPARISQLECKIEALLCQLPARQPRRSRLMRSDDNDGTVENSCRMNLEKCIEDAKLSSHSDDLTGFLMPSSTSPTAIGPGFTATQTEASMQSTLSSTTERSETTTKKVVILVSTTTRPVVIQSTFASTDDIDTTSTKNPL
jgi:hypothetical protein